MLPTAEFGFDGVIGATQPVQGGFSLDSSVIVSKLQELDPGFHADLGSRLGVWHPNMDRWQGLFYMQKHICSLDRGASPQWPEWTTVNDVVEVPLDYALLHDDMPILDFDPFREHESVGEEPTASILRPVLDDVQKVGWAEVFHRLLKSGVHSDINVGWLARTFGVPMDWYAKMGMSPLSYSYQYAKDRGMAA